jgi:hypothetical protein
VRVRCVAGLGIACVALSGCSTGGRHTVSITDVSWSGKPQTLKVTTTACSSPRVSKQVADRKLMLSATGTGRATCHSSILLPVVQSELGLLIVDRSSNAQFWLGQF